MVDSGSALRAEWGDRTKVVDGGQRAIVKAPLEKIPLFVRV